MMRITIALLVLLGLCTQNTVWSQSFNHSPLEILKSWDYYKLIDQFGEGMPIIDTLSGQAYIAGMTYRQNWLGRPADVSFLFKKTDIDGLRLRFWSPYLTQRTNTKIPDKASPETRDSLLQAYKIQDSLHRISIGSFLKKNPHMIDSLKLIAAADSIEQKRLYDLDSIRCDSIVLAISEIMGAPIKTGLTHHTDFKARYSASWINQGFSVGLRDNTDYTDIVFSIPVINRTTAAAFEIDENSEVFHKTMVEVKGQELALSLLGTPHPSSASAYSGIQLLVEPAKGMTYLEQVFDEADYYRPSLQLMDFNSDGIREVWVSAFADLDGTCRFDQIYTLELIEPIVLFDFFEETVYNIGGAFLEGFQAEVAMANGHTELFSLDYKDMLVPQYYNVKGNLARNENVIPACLKELKAIKTDSKGIQLQGIISLSGETFREELAQLLVTWELQSGVWEVVESVIIAIDL